ncbi:hypothetical protein [Acinetobacter sp. ANC 4648]|uniref:hypothetical protein n=1 Tax=Acinetobacter sp. ANC 4648 TaxID=1977875 RepID=UPI000A32FC05|nr:hypothetical protein [Acinetobacter sp. ANC 4648]OTG80641.1 hypothetical protein B9T27_12255 [Acinetobacter sp. ANC 4648]
MRKIILTSLVMSFTIAPLEAKSVTASVNENFQDVAIDCTGSCESTVADAINPVSSSDYAKSIKPMHEKYTLDAGDEWEGIYSNANAQFFESAMTQNDGIQYVGAWIKRVDQKKKQQHINYYQVLCTDQTFTLLEQFQSKDDQKYTTVNNVDHYRQAQTFSKAGEELPIFKKLCKNREDFVKAWGL